MWVNAKLFIISGPSGVGKTTLVKKLIKDIPNLVKVVTYTTRKPRLGEAEGRDYKFVSYNEFMKLRKEGRLLESAFTLGNYYGTPKEDVVDNLKKGKDVLLCIDVKGARKVKKMMPTAVSIFILPPNMQELLRRLKKRKASRKEMREKIALAKKELKELTRYDYIIINDSLNRALLDIKAIIKAEKLKIERKKMKEIKDVIYSDRTYLKEHRKCLQVSIAGFHESD